MIDSTLVTVKLPRVNITINSGPIEYTHENGTVETLPPAYD